MLFFRFVRSAIFLTALFTLTACSSLPAQLASENLNLITDYAVWQQNATSPAEVRLGGVIARVDNLAGNTRIEVVNLPINSVGKPSITQEPEGRFVAYLPGFKDPVTLAPGRLITLLGSTNGTEVSRVGDFEYDFLVMKATGYRLWRVEERVIMNESGSYLHPCRGFYCRDRYSPFREGRVIQEVK